MNRLYENKSANGLVYIDLDSVSAILVKDNALSVNFVGSGSWTPLGLDVVQVPIFVEMWKNWKYPLRNAVPTSK